jgi:G3E family GTPase
VEQIAFADRILLNKTDLVTAEELKDVTKEIRLINSSAEIITCQYSKVEPRKLMSIQAFNLQKVLTMDA